MVQEAMVAHRRHNLVRTLVILSSGFFLSLFFIPSSAYAATTYGFSTYGSGTYGGAGDSTPPVISSIATSTTATTATITWTTDEGASDVVRYGTTISYGASSSTVATSTSHTIVLTGLTALTTYHYQIESTDDFGNVATTSDAIFTTTAAPDTTPPTVSVTAPSSGAVISGASVSLSATSSDNVGVTSVQFYIDATPTGSAGATSPYTITFNSGSVADGSHTISAVARDAANNVATSTISVTVDNTAPTISSVASSTSATAATISWTTNENSTSVVNYGPTTGYGTSSSSASMVTSHSISLTGLTPSTLYHFALTSVDPYSNSTTSADYTFTTTAAPDTTPPVISSVASSTTNTTAILTWTTDENSTSVVNYGLTTGYGTASSSSSLVTSHTISLTGLTPLTLYHFALTSVDASSNSTTTTDYTFTTSATPDTTPPVISSVASSTASTTATITWTTNEAASSTVLYGPTTSYGTSSTSASMVTSHSITLTGLTASTLYHFQVGGADASNNISTSSDLTFTTAAPPDTTPPTISSVASSTANTTATITWTTNENSTSVVNYGLTSSYGTSSSSASMVTSHSITLTGLTPSTLYHFALTSVDASSNSTTTTDYTFTTTTDVTAPVISSIVSTPSTVSAVVTWITDEDSTSQVVYSTDLSYSNATTLNAGMVTAHAESISGLVTGTTYNFKVVSMDASNNISTSSAQSFTTTSPSSGGGGGGGGGGAFVYVPGITPGPAPTPVALPASSFTQNLTVGSENLDVRALQTILAAKGYLQTQYITGYFGALTKQALIQLQKAAGISPASGYFGPLTRQYVRSLGSSTPSAVPTVQAPVQPTPTPTPQGTAVLQLGSTGPSVIALQQFLRSYPAFYPSGQITGYYGTLTREAVGAFQLHYTIVASRSESGYGNVGPRTRAKIDELLR